MEILTQNIFILPFLTALGCGLFSYGCWALLRNKNLGRNYLNHNRKVYAIIFMGLGTILFSSLISITVFLK